MELMRIGEVARQTGVAVKTLRYYEAIGVLPKPGRTDENYRDYPTEILDHVAFVKAGQSVGLSLREIREIIAVRNAGSIPCQHVLGLLRRRADEYQAKIDELTKAQETLAALIERAASLEPADCGPDDICHLIPLTEPGTNGEKYSFRSAS